MGNENLPVYYSM